MKINTTWSALSSQLSPVELLALQGVFRGREVYITSNPQKGCALYLAGLPQELAAKLAHLAGGTWLAVPQPAQLTALRDRAICALLTAGYTQDEVCAAFGVGYRVVARAAKQRRDGEKQKGAING